MSNTLEHVDASIDPVELAGIMQRDGAAIVLNALNPDQLASLNGELDGAVEAAGPGLRNPTDDFFVEFYGKQTIRLDGLPARSKTFQEIMESQPITGVADTLLLPSCEHYLLNTGRLIQIGPGESAQLLHRDEDAWAEMPHPRPLLQVEAMFALSDFSIENGCTQVVPGSHLWEPDREPEPDEVQRAEMPAGSALFYLGCTIHGGGANTTTDQWRRGMFFGFVVGWLRTEENCYLSVPLEVALGHLARDIGVVDVGSPLILMKQGLL